MHSRMPCEIRKKGYHPPATKKVGSGHRPKSMIFKGFGLLVQLYRVQNRRGVVAFSWFIRFLQANSLYLRIRLEFWQDPTPTRCLSTLNEQNFQNLISRNPVPPYGLSLGNLGSPRLKSGDFKIDPPTLGGGMYFLW